MWKKEWRLIIKEVSKCLMLCKQLLPNRTLRNSLHLQLRMRREVKDQLWRKISRRKRNWHRKN